MGGPGRRGHKLPAGVRLIHGEGFIRSAGRRNLRRNRRVATARLAAEHIRRGQHLRRVTDGGDGLAGLREMTHDFQHARVEAEVFRRAAARNYKAVVVFGAHLIKRRIQGEIVTPFLTVGLVALEIMDGGPHGFAGPFIRADGMDDMADHEERLKGNHHLVVFNIVANQHQKFFCSQDEFLLRLWSHFGDSGVVGPAGFEPATY